MEFRIFYRCTCNVVPLLVLSATAVGSDFRNLDFGETCDLIFAQETSLPTIEFDSQTRQPWRFNFKSSAFNREAEILYVCSDNLLISGAYQFAVEDLSHATKSLRSIALELESIYGPPAFYNTPWQQGASAPFVSADVRRYMVVWRDSRKHMTASLLRVNEESDELWRVIVIVAHRVK